MTTSPRACRSAFSMKAIGVFVAVLTGLLLLPLAATGQSTGWIRKYVAGPTPRRNHAMVFDIARSTTMLFGGHTGDYNGETWTWNGVWTRYEPSESPSPRYGHAMAYDVAHEVTVLFSGLAVDGGSHETWEWNGITWVLRAVVGPSPRMYHAMAHDSARGVTVLFGGFDIVTGLVLNDTWEWNGLVWTQRLVNGPSARFSHAMCYDVDQGKTVLFGGSSNGLNGETWEWDGVAGSWTQRTGGPRTTSSPTLAYDPGRRVNVLFARSQTFENAAGIDGWTDRNASGPSVYHNAMVFDSSRDVLVIFGGTNFLLGGLNGNTWERHVPCSAITSQPVSTETCPGRPTNFTVGVEGIGPFTYQWQAEATIMPGTWIDLLDHVSGAGFIYGTETASLTVWPHSSAAATRFRVIVTDRCTTMLSDVAELTVEDTCCAADFNKDGIVDFFDYLDFVREFSAGC